MKDVALGDDAVDIITGFQGVAVGKMERLFGTTEFHVQQRSLNGDERPQDPVWIEASRLQVKEQQPHTSGVGHETSAG